MKYAKLLGLAAAAAMALMAVGASTASATGLYKTGHGKMIVGDQFSATLEPGSTASLTSTAEDPIVTCTESSVAGSITNSGGAGVNVGGSVSHLTFTGGCDVTVDQSKNGTLSVEHHTGTTDGTVRGFGFYVTIHSPFVGTCNYGLASNTDLGTLIGNTSGNATIRINAIVTEQKETRILCPDTTRWIAEYLVTSPSSMWVEAS